MYKTQPTIVSRSSNDLEDDATSWLMSWSFSLAFSCFWFLNMARCKRFLAGSGLTSCFTRIQTWMWISPNKPNTVGFCCKWCNQIHGCRIVDINNLRNHYYKFPSSKVCACFCSLLVERKTKSINMYIYNVKVYIIYSSGNAIRQIPCSNTTFET